MDINNKIELLLAQLIFESASNTYFMLIWDKMNESMGVRLKRAVEDKVITERDLKCLREIYEMISNENYSNADNYIPKLEKIIEKIIDDENDYVIGEKIKTSDEFNFLDTFEEEVIKIYIEAKEITKSIELSSTITGQVWDDFEVIVKIYDSSEDLLDLDEEAFCKKLDLIYYNDKLHWPTLKEWLIKKGCPEKYLGQFRLRFNAIYVKDIMDNNIDISIKEMLKYRNMI